MDSAMPAPLFKARMARPGRESSRLRVAHRASSTQTQIRIVDVPAARQRDAEDMDGFDAGDAVVLPQGLDVAEQEVQATGPQAMVPSGR